jgi:hypothetical protein
MKDRAPSLLLDQAADRPQGMRVLGCIETSNRFAGARSRIRLMDGELQIKSVEQRLPLIERARGWLTPRDDHHQDLNLENSETPIDCERAFLNGACPPASPATG